MAAFEWAVQNNTDMLELDVHLTLDEEVVVSHDADISRMTGKPGHIPDIKYDGLFLFRFVFIYCFILILDYLKNFSCLFLILFIIYLSMKPKKICLGSFLQGLKLDHMLLECMLNQQNLIVIILN
jgi:glycerophosphoryl diester phosphodiesterase